MSWRQSVCLWRGLHEKLSNFWDYRLLFWQKFLKCWHFITVAWSGEYAETKLFFICTHLIKQCLLHLLDSVLAEVCSLLTASTCCYPTKCSIGRDTKFTVSFVVCMYMIGYGFLSSGFTDQCEILLGGSVVFDCFWLSVTVQLIAWGDSPRVGQILGIIRAPCGGICFLLKRLFCFLLFYYYYIYFLSLFLVYHDGVYDGVLTFPRPRPTKLALRPTTNIPIYIFAIFVRVEKVEISRCPWCSNFEDDAVTLANVGTTAEVLAVKEDVDDLSGLAATRIKAIGRQRFKVISTTRQVGGWDSSFVDGL